MSPGGRRPRRWPRLISVATAALVVAPSLVWAHAGRGAAGTDAAPTAAQVAPVLHRRGAAVLERSRGAFLADVDPGPASAAFRQRQATSFADLAPVPLSAWSYQLPYGDGAQAAAAAVVHDPSAVAAARRRYGRAVLIVQVHLVYALRGIDPVPAAHDLWWTFGRRDGRVVLLGDDDLVAQGSPSFRGPWDFGPLTVARGAHSIVLAHPGVAVAPVVIAHVADQAVAAVERAWTRPWARAVAIEVPGSDAEQAALLGSTSAETGIDAATVIDQQDPVAGSRAGQRVVLVPAALARISAVGLGIVLRHETTHVATSADTTPLTPRWLIEGYAEWVANQGTGQSVRTAAAELRRAVAAGQLPRRLPADSDFDAASGTGEAVLYQLSWLACRLIADTAGAAALARFYVNVGSGPGDTDQNTASALRSALHESTAAFVARWRASLRAELG